MNEFQEIVDLICEGDFRSRDEAIERLGRLYHAVKYEGEVACWPGSSERIPEKFLLDMEFTYKTAEEYEDRGLDD